MRSFVVAVLAAGTAWTGGLAVAAPITFNTALPVSRHEIVLRELLLRGHAADRRDGTKRAARGFSPTTVVAYGVTPDLAVIGVVPLNFRTMKINGARRSASGFGDLKLLARYTVLRRDAPGKTFRLAPFLGLKAPTGRDGRAAPGGPLPGRLLPGSEAWDFFGGLIATFASTAWNLDIEAGYRLTTTANGLDAGDIKSLNASLQYRLLPTRLDRRTKGFLYGVLEMNVRDAGRTRRLNAPLAGSGGTTVLIAPGLQYATRRWIVEAAVQLPLVRQATVLAPASDVTVVAGFRINF